MALYPNDAIGVTTTNTFSSMVDKRPDSGYSVQKSFTTTTFVSESGYEKRRLKSRRGLRTYNLSYTNITGLEKGAIESFYNARSGEFESFDFDLTHVNETGIIRVRFDGALDIRHVLTVGLDVLNNIYSVSFKLKETYD